VSVFVCCVGMWLLVGFGMVMGVMGWMLVGGIEVGVRVEWV